MSKRKQKLRQPTYQPRNGFLKDRFVERVTPKSDALLRIEELQAQIATSAQTNVTPIRKRGAS